ncbi:uncharacterized protein Triagg1_3352 [Trichoderma aggressivum f. europaeum]|uniref:Uncharacterized protein n=1 Tax=Trichoderma aggressivum f. europaeum TaxID=173218 RepID=A0AAE1IFV4_9HYPO|nr:hypothetical protein Triagg1_3352 [Trichoderma aggressivum f. europaeum]
MPPLHLIDKTSPMGDSVSQSAFAFGRSYGKGYGTLAETNDLELRIMHFNSLFTSIGVMALLPAFAPVMAENCMIQPPPTETFLIPLNFCFYHDFGIVDIRVEIPGANLRPKGKADHLELPAHVKANADPIHLDETYGVNIYFKNDWTNAHRWEVNIPLIVSLYVDLQTRIDRSNCKLGLKLHLTGWGALGALDESIPLTEIDNDGIKLLAQGLGLCS